MANIKNNKKKGSFSNTNNKSKRKVNRKNKDYNAKIESVGEFNTNFRQIITVVGIIVIIFCAFYFLTVLLTRDETKKNTKDESNTTISYKNIIAGRSFSMPENEYLVLYYDYSDTEVSTDMSSVVSEYSTKENHLVLYTVDMNDAINKAYVSDEGNYSPSKTSELAINGTTLIHFKKGQVVDYFEGIDDVKGYLE